MGGTQVIREYLVTYHKSTMGGPGRVARNVGVSKE